MAGSNLDTGVIAGILKFKEELLREENKAYLMYLIFLRFRGDNPFESFAEINKYMDQFTERFRNYDEKSLIDYFEEYMKDDAYLINFPPKERPWF